MKEVLVINSSSVQMTLRKTSMTSVFTVLLFLIFTVGLPSLSLSTNAAQTESGNVPDSGTISDTFVLNGIVVSGTDSPFGGSVIYSVLPNTEYYIRVYAPPRLSKFLKNVRFFSSYPSLGAKAVNYYPDNDISRHGDYVVFHFTTPSNASFAVLTFRFDSSYTDYESVKAFIQSASIGDTLGLYTPLSNNSTAELSFGFTNPRELKLFLSGSGGAGNYRFTVDIHYTDNNSENLLSQVSAGSYTRVVPALDNGDYLTVTISDILTSISTKITPYIPDVNINTLSSPEIDTDYIPETSISLDNGVADIIVDSWSVIPSEITALLIPVVLFSLIGWWLHK